MSPLPRCGPPPRCCATISDSMALMWNATDPKIAELLAALLHKLKPRKK